MDMCSFHLPLFVREKHFTPKCKGENEAYFFPLHFDIIFKIVL